MGPAGGENVPGFFKIDRQIFDSDIWMQPVELRLFIYLIGQARFAEKPNKKYKNKGVIIKKGQFLRSYRKLKEDLEYMKNNAIKNYSLSKIKRAIDNLENQGRIKTEKTPLRTLFTIVNYRQYQEDKEINNKHGTKMKRSKNAGETQVERNRNNTKNGVRMEKECINNNNVSPKFEIKKIYNSLDNYWRTLFKDYIDVYRFNNKTNKITNNRHLKLLKELKGIFDNMKFSFDGENYNLSENIFEEGINTIIEREIDNLNYAKKIWISKIKEGQNEFSRGSSKKERKNKQRKISKYDKDVIYG